MDFLAKKPNQKANGVKAENKKENGPFISRLGQHDLNEAVSFDKYLFCSEKENAWVKELLK